LISKGRSVRRAGWCLGLGVIVALSIALMLPLSASAMKEFPLPTPASQPFGIAGGPDGALWFTEQNANKIGRITTAGAITEFPIPTQFAAPFEIVAGSDGALWFTEAGANNIGRITTSGTITEYPLPANTAPDGIASGPDGAIWFTERGPEQIGRIDPANPGTPASPILAHFPLLAGMFDPSEITSGPDGRLWFTLPSASLVGAIDPATGTVQGYSRTGEPTGIVASSTSLWFTKYSGNEIENLSVSGSTLGVVQTDMGPSGITLGPDGALWIAESLAGKIGRATTSGDLLEYTVPAVVSSPTGIAAGPDSSVWFTEFDGNSIGRIRTGSYAPTNLVVNQSGRVVTASWSLPLPAPETFSGFLEFSPTPDVDGDGFFTDSNSFGLLLDSADTTFDSTPDRLPPGTYYVHVSAVDPTTCDQLGFCRDEFSPAVVLVVPPDPQPQPASSAPKPAPAPADTVTTFASLKARSSQRVGRLTIQAAMSEAGTITAGGTVSVPRLSKVYRFKTATANAVPGISVTLRLKLPAKKLKAVKRALKARKKLKAKITITATDHAGNKKVERRTIRLLR
jgi:virginiamycin B lyase